MHGTEGHHNCVRALIVDLISTNREDFEQFVDDEDVEVWKVWYAKLVLCACIVCLLVALVSLPDCMYVCLSLYCGLISKQDG